MKNKIELKKVILNTRALNYYLNQEICGDVWRCEKMCGNKLVINKSFNNKIYY